MIRIFDSLENALLTRLRKCYGVQIFVWTIYVCGVDMRWMAWFGSEFMKQAVAACLYGMHALVYVLIGLPADCTTKVRKPRESK